VDVFFVISGFLITDLLAAPWDRGGRLELRSFWIRRARRLLPCLAVVLVTVTAAVAVLAPQELPGLRPALLAAVTYTSNWWQALHHQSYFAVFGPPPPLQHLWSLAIEEQFYLIWPLVLTVILCARRGRRARAAVAWLGAAASAVAMAAGYAAGEDPSRLYYGTDTHATALLVGAALALTWPLQRLTTASVVDARRLDLVGLAGVSVLAWEMGHISGGGVALYLGGIAIAAVAAGAVVVAAAAPGMLARMFSWAPLRWIGVRSYGIYLWHWPVIALFAAREGTQSTTLAVRAAETATAITLAAASWRWIEAPIVRNGFGVTLRAKRTVIARSIAAARQSPRRALPALITLAGFSVAALAGYGVLYSPSGQSLEQQIEAGARVSASSRAPAKTGAARVASHPAGTTAPTAPSVITRASLKHLGRDITAIGDSVMLASAAQLRAELPGIYVDARVSRQISQGIAVTQQLDSGGELRPIVVVGLGTNGAVTMQQVRALMAVAGQKRMLVLVNTFVPRPWQAEVNTVVADAARRYRDVALANWFATIRNRTSLLWEDDVHPRPAGGALYARMVATAARRAASRIEQRGPASRPAVRPGWQPSGRRLDKLSG
jgi:peptidoglycan/LPS O-acetylase OafA/YrhL